MVARQLLEESHAYDAVVEIVTTTDTEPGHDDDTDDDDEGGAPVVANPEQQSKPMAATTTTTTTKTRKIARDRHAYILATLVSNLEKTFTISPASRPLDGRLRLVHFGDVGGPRTMDVMMRVYDGGKHVGMRFDEKEKENENENEDEEGVKRKVEGGGEEEEEHVVGYEEVAEVRVTTREPDARWRKVCIDGTIVELPLGGTMTVTVEGKGEAAHLQILVDRSVVP